MNDKLHGIDRYGIDVHDFNFHLKHLNASYPSLETLAALEKVKMLNNLVFVY